VAQQQCHFAANAACATDNQGDLVTELSKEASAEAASSMPSTRFGMPRIGEGNMRWEIV
jgi:hypothetical protein